MKVLATAYACRPGAGSEDGNGWWLANQLTRFGDVWVLTPSHNRAAIESAHSRVHFVYVDVPGWPAGSDAANRLRRTHYNLWQLRILPVAKQLQRKIGFDIVHHLTYAQYWTGSWMGELGVPFIWGPVGGGESAPASLIATLPRDGRRFERNRDFARAVGRRSPAVSSAARTATLALATTEDSQRAMQSLGASRIRLHRDNGKAPAAPHHHRVVEVLSNCALPDAEFDKLGSVRHERENFRVMCVGRLEHWKGFHLTIAAFAALVDDFPHAELHIVGDGPAETYLRAQILTLRLERNVKLLGRLPRPQVLDRLANSHVLAHPSLHDSSGWATLEAAAVGLPIVCLDLGGPALQVTDHTGIKIAVHDAANIVPLMTQAFATLAAHPHHAEQLGAAGRLRVRQHFTWDRIGDQLATKAPYSNQTNAAP